jgi:hypothetical protein
LKLFIAAAALLTLVGCGDLSDSGGGDGGGGSDDDSSLACDHFRNVASDAAEGLYTEAELREKLKEVEGNAIIATPAVQRAATDMLSAITQGQSQRFERAIGDMSAACSAAGH